MKNMKMPAGNRDLKINYEKYLKINNLALGAMRQVSKKDLVNIGRLRPPELAVTIPSPCSTFDGTFPRLPVTGPGHTALDHGGHEGGYREDCDNLLEAALLKLVQPR